MELIDTAGLRASADEAEAMGIAKSREAMADADVVVVVVDATVGMSAEDEALIAGLEGRARWWFGIRVIWLVVWPMVGFGLRRLRGMGLRS